MANDSRQVIDIQKIRKRKAQAGKNGRGSNRKPGWVLWLQFILLLLVCGYVMKFCQSGSWSGETF